LYFKTLSAGILGVDGFLVEVETDITSGLPQYSLVGLPDSAVKESKERVRSAIRNSGFTFPLGRITINLAPADIRKVGPAFDLAVAVGILCASGQWHIQGLASILLIGELSLDGHIKPVQGLLPMALAAKERGCHSIIAAKENATEASLAGLNTYCLEHLRQLPSLLKEKPWIPDPFPSSDDKVNQLTSTFPAIIGQLNAKRALEIAAAGFHNILFIGPPGTGKTLLASCLPKILPPLSRPEWLEIVKIYSVAGKINLFPSSERPFRSPHHSITAAGLIGGGTYPKPGELTLAHRGALFLDEILEFPRQLLDLLRQPLEEHTIEIHRNRGKVVFPAHFMLIGSMNPCPCGYFGFEDNQHFCKCGSSTIEKYQRKLSGPLLDRFDIQVEVRRMEKSPYPQSQETGEEFNTMRHRIQNAVQMQQTRFNDPSFKNSEMSPEQIHAHCPMSPSANLMLQTAYEKFHISHRGYHRILKVARTIADLDGRESLSESDIAEAIQYRLPEKKISTIVHPCG
jgi:magnesium chelatase family protein